MKKFIFVFLFLLTPLTAFAGYESVTVSDTAIGLGSSIPQYGGDRASCVITLEGAPIRLRFDGTNPTSSEGHVMTPGGTLKLQGAQISAFRAIRLNSVNATLKASCNDATSADLKDIMLESTRTPVSYFVTGAASGATTVVTAMTLTKSSGLSTNTTGTSFIIPTGKKFRITQLSVATRGNSVATAQSTVFSIMTNTTGVISASSTTLFQIQSATPATALDWDRVMFTIPDGYEIQGDGTLQWGVVGKATFTTNAPTWDVNIIGYEY